MASIQSIGGFVGTPGACYACVRELNTYRRGEPCTERYGVELIRRATVQGDQEAWAWAQHCFGGVVLNWLRCHPQKARACRLESEEHYVAQAFERFWQATASNKRVEFHPLAAALQYLRASLNGTILDTLRAYVLTGQGDARDVERIQQDFRPDLKKEHRRRLSVIPVLSMHW